MIELIEPPVTAAISEYNPVAAGLAELRRKYGNVVVDVSTTKALNEARKVRAAIREPRYETEKIRKALKAPALAHAKLIDSEAARITAELLQIETPWDEAIKAEEAREAAEKAEAERIERLRVETIHLRIADIREAGNLALQCRTSAMVEALIDELDGATLEHFDEFAEEAERARETTLARMKEIAETKRAEEQERARIKAEQEAEAARLAAERAENARIAAELERQRKEAAEAERIAAHERAAQEAKAKAAREAAEAAAKAQRDAEALRLADERAAFEAEQAAARAAAQAQADELARQRAEFDAELRRRAAEAEALQEAAKPLPAPELQPVIVATDTDIFNQEDGSDLLDGPMSPSDAEVIACAAAAVAQRWGMNFNDALNRLAEVQEWIVAETT